MPIGINVNFEMVTARCGFGLARPVIDQRTNTGVSVNDVGGSDGLFKICASGFADIIDFFGRRENVVERTFVIGIGRADKGEIILIGNGEEDPAIGVLAEIRLRRIEHFAHNDMRPAHKPDGFGCVTLPPRGTRKQFKHRWPCCVGNGARLDGWLPCNFDMPDAVAPFDVRHFGVRADFRAMLCGVHGVKDHQSGVIDPAIGIFKRSGELGLQRLTGGFRRKRYGAGRGEQFAAANMVI